MDFEENEEYLYGELTDRIIRDREREFTEGCREAYKAIMDIGIPNLEDAKLFTEEVINRMLGYFIQTEEYEKCFNLKEFFINLFGKSPSPVFPRFDLKD